MLTGIINERRVEHEIDPDFARRWSQRAMSGEEVSEEELMSLFEAARWAPSSYNNQPWRFVYADRTSPQFQNFLEIMDEGNRVWAKDAAVLMILASKKTFDKTGKPSRTHSFDAGAAWENLALQASRSQLVCHAMEGFDYERAYEVANIPHDRFEIQAMIAIGKPGPVEVLPPKLQEKEHPSDRKPLEEIAFKNEFPSLSESGHPLPTTAREAGE